MSQVNCLTNFSYLKAISHVKRLDMLFHSAWKAPLVAAWIKVGYFQRRSPLHHGGGIGVQFHDIIAQFLEILDNMVFWREYKWTPIHISKTIWPVASTCLKLRPRKPCSGERRSKHHWLCSGAGHRIFLYIISLTPMQVIFVWNIIFIFKKNNVSFFLTVCEPLCVIHRTYLFIYIHIL